MLGVGEEAGDVGLAAAAEAEAEGQGEAGGCMGGFQQVVVKQEGDVAMQEAAGVVQVCIRLGCCLRLKGQEFCSYPCEAGR
jgi:hypothetical protein